MTATEGQKNLPANSPFGIGAGTVGGHVGPRTWAVRDAVAVVAAVARLAMRECPVRDVHRDKLDENDECRNDKVDQKELLRLR